jgi:hypothetical protein
MAFYARAYGESEVINPGITQQALSQYNAHQKIHVPAAPLDYVLKQQGIEASQVAFVWSDTQGCETDVIESGERLWVNGVPLYAEIWPAGLDLHRGVDEFIGQAKKNFSALIAEEDLISKGENSEINPVEKIETIISNLHKKERDQISFTDVLFLPRI